MRTGMLALALGLLTLRFLPALPPGWLLAIAACAGLALLLSRLYPLGFFLLGLAWACSSAQSALDDRLAAQLDGRTLWLEGRVVGLPEVSEGVVRFLLEEAHSRRAELPQRLRVAWYGGPTVQGGERWRLAVNLKRPHGLVNPQRFDYEAWLLAQRIGATGTIKSGERLSSATGLGSWRDSLRQQLLAVPAFERQGAIAALVLGDGSGLSTTDWRLLQHTGTVHLMVISGQHIALLAGFLYGLVALLAKLGAWPRRLPWLPCACALALSGALLYGFLAGFEVPVRRACVMVALVLLWRMRFRHLGAWWPLLLALIVVLLLEPLASLQPGFWLSFSAVAILVLVFAGRLGLWGWWRGLTRAQWTMAIGLLPMMLILGLPVSSSGPLANLIAVPWVGMLVCLWRCWGLCCCLSRGWVKACCGWPVVHCTCCSNCSAPLLPGYRPGCPATCRCGPGYWLRLARCCFCCRLVCPCAGPASRCYCRHCFCRRRSWTTGVPTSGCWMSGRGWPCWCVPGSTHCFTMPGRVSAISIPVSVSSCLRCAR